MFVPGKQVQSFNEMMARHITHRYVFLASIAVLITGCSEVKLTAATNHSKSIRVLLVGGGSSHNFDRWYHQADAATLEAGGLAVVTYTSNPDSIVYYLLNTDVLLLCNNQPVNDTGTRKAIFEFVNTGHGIILAHATLWYNWKDWPEYNLQIAGGGSNGHDQYGEFHVNVTESDHPVTKGVERQFAIKDERYYYQPDVAGPGIIVLANSNAEGSDKVYPSVFIVKHPKARIVSIALGHDAAAHELPEYQLLLRNAVKWVAGK